MTKETKFYEEKQGIGWWISNKRYFTYAMRETAGLLMSIYVFLFIYELSQLQNGPTAHNAFRIFAQSPVMFIISVIILAFTLLHSVTWFHLTGKIQKPKIKGKVPPDSAVVVINVIILVMVSYFVYWLIW